MGFEDFNTLTEVCREAYVHDGGMPLKAVAAAVGKPYPTLTRELNPDDDGAKLGADMLMPLMQATGDIRPLEWLAGRMGYALRKSGDIQPDRPTWTEEHAQDSAIMGELTAAMLKGDDVASVQGIARRLIADIEQTVEQYARMGGKK